MPISKVSSIDVSCHMVGNYRKPYPLSFIGIEMYLESSRYLWDHD